MRPLKHITAAATASLVLTTGLAPAQSNIGNARITAQGDQICIQSNGLPNHTTGSFPNQANPHAIAPQRISACVDASPRKNYRVQ